MHDKNDQNMYQATVQRPAYPPHPLRNIKSHSMHKTCCKIPKQRSYQTFWSFRNVEHTSMCSYTYTVTLICELQDESGPSFRGRRFTRNMEGSQSPSPLPRSGNGLGIFNLEGVEVPTSFLLQDALKWANMGTLSKALPIARKIVQ